MEARRVRSEGNHEKTSNSTQHHNGCFGRSLQEYGQERVGDAGPLGIQRVEDVLLRRQKAVI